MIIPLTSGHVDECLAVISSLPAWFGWDGALDNVGESLRTQRGFVAVEDTLVSGFVTFTPVFEETVEISYLAVHSDRRRASLGRSLVIAVRDAAIEIGATSICLLTLGPSANNLFYDETVAFYRAIGFSRTKELPLSSWGGAPALVMSAPLGQIG
jgi:ribosomal protein S18 acetylase RimI-like enzyme